MLDLLQLILWLKAIWLINICFDALSSPVQFAGCCFNDIMNTNCQISHITYKNTSRFSQKSVFLLYTMLHSTHCIWTGIKMNVRRIVRLQKQWLILVFLFGYYVNLPALYSMSMLPFDSPPIPFPIYLPTHLPYWQKKNISECRYFLKTDKTCLVN